MGASFIDEIIGRLDIDIEGASKGLEDVIAKLLKLREVIRESNQIIELLDNKLKSLKSSTQIDSTEHRDFGQHLDDLENQIESLSCDIGKIGSDTGGVIGDITASVTSEAVKEFEKVINQLRSKVDVFRNEHSDIQSKLGITLLKGNEGTQ